MKPSHMAQLSGRSVGDRLEAQALQVARTSAARQLGTRFRDLSLEWLPACGGLVAARFGGRDLPPPWIVLVHGFVVSSLYLAPTTMGLAVEHPVMSPDLPGTGRSAKSKKKLLVPDLADVLIGCLDAARIERAVLVGCSFGCQVVVDAAARFADRVERVVLLAPTLDPAERSLPLQAVRWLRNAWYEPRHLASVLVNDAFHTGPLGAAAAARAMMSDFIDGKLPLVHCPALVVRGEHDPVVPAPWARCVASLLPQGQYAEIPGSAHTLSYDSARPLVELIGSFARGG